MSFAVQHASSSGSGALAALDGRRDRGPSPAEGDDRQRRSLPNSRHALLDAVGAAVEALVPGSSAAADARPGREQPLSRQAMHAFVHALLAELRPAAGDDGHGRGFAWGRTSVATLAQRLDDLVARLQAGSTAPTAPASQAAAAGGADRATAAAPSASAAAAAPSASAAAAAPPAPLLTAFGKLATARGGSDDRGATGDALLALLRQVAGALGDSEAPAPTIGGLLDVTA